MARGHNNIQQWLIPLLEERGLSIEHFSYLADLNKSTLYNYLSDKIRPKPEVMARMCMVLDVPEEEGMAQYTPRVAPLSERKRRR